MLLLLVACNAPTTGLDLEIVDAASGDPTPARVEIVDAAGDPWISADALRVAGDCGWKPIHNWVRWWAQIQMWRALDAGVRNPFTGTTQFYVDGPAGLDLAPGTYRVRVWKGLEYRVAEHSIEIGAGERRRLLVPLSRWAHLAAAGWYSADDHLHIARPHRRFDRRIARWMQAEDLNVANLLQMGLARGIHITPQHGFDAATVYRDGGTVVASGQENPRTHVLGHAITLGAGEWLDAPEAYLAYDRLWRQAHQRGGINGYAHWGLGGADEGLATWAPDGLLDFLEVLGFSLPHYRLWYDLLDLGIHLTPTAGTDYPCLPSLPGRDRFYAYLDTPLSYGAWIDAVRRGRTFVTNGPLLELAIAGAGPGDRIELEGPTDLAVEARVRFDPGRDDVRRLELVRGGEVLATASEPVEPGEIRLRTAASVERTSWFALRAHGVKLGETPLSGMALLEEALTFLPRTSAEQLLAGPGRTLPRDGDPRPATAHTSPIYVAVAGTPPLERQPAAAAAARRLLALLGELEARFSSDRIGELAGFPGRGDGVELEDLESGRDGLLESVARARARYLHLLGRQPPRDDE